ncbi:MAG TPA: glycosyltransferase family 9 protein [Bdellovibrionales bacterium]|nr:glycosyltransferase family 9 protein [Bdellovibrionales bacterium]
MKRIKEWDFSTPVVLACRPGLGDFFVRFGLADVVISVDKKKGAEEALKQLRAQEWDTIFSPHESVRTALWMRSLKAKRKVGFRKWWNGLVYDTRVERPLDFPDALRQLSLLTPLDSRLAELFGSEEAQALRSPTTRSGPVDFRVPMIPEWASMQVMQHSPERGVVFLAPGSVWATKRWTQSGYVDLACALLSSGVDVELVGSKAEKPLCDEIQQQVHAHVVAGMVKTLSAGFLGKLTNKAGETSLTELVLLLNKGVALVSNDSGAMHAAAAAGLPTVAVFGPTTLDLGYRPWQNRAIVIQHELGCRPCGKHGHDRCPIGTHACMKNITPSEVLGTLQQLI